LIIPGAVKNSSPRSLADNNLGLQEKNAEGITFHAVLRNPLRRTNLTVCLSRRVTEFNDHN